MLPTSFLILFFTTSLFSQAGFQPSYNAATNTVSVTYETCNSCVIGYTYSQPNYCECVEKWQGSDEEKAYCKHLEGTQWINWCKYEFIKSKCGEYQKIPKKTIVSYRYRLVAAYAAIPFDPKQNSANWVNFFSPLIVSSTVSIPNWQPSSPWPQIANGKKDRRAHV